MSDTKEQSHDHRPESNAQVASQSGPTAETGSKTFRIRPATRADIPAIAKLLSDAFQDGDPISEWIFPDEQKRRRRQLRMLNTLIVHRYLPVNGAEVATSGDDIVGVSLFRRSWEKPSTARRMIGNLVLLRVLGSRIFAGSAVDAALDAAAPSGPNVCLVYLACRSSWARQGVGTALFTSLFVRAGDIGAALYGIMKPGNFSYYTSIFEDLGVLDRTVNGEVTIGRHGPTLKTLEISNITDASAATGTHNQSA